MKDGGVDELISGLTERPKEREFRKEKTQFFNCPF